MEKTFSIERTYDAPVSKVWRALTDKKQMKQWYFDVPDFEPAVGNEFHFSGQGNKGEKYIHLCKIVEIVPEKKLSYSWQYEGYPGKSVVTFELFSEGNKTRLKLTHAGLETFAQDNSDFAEENFAKGWTYITGTSLHNFLQKNEE
jgi:uncharacterized protein YndB with AHSA1/START domain